MEDIQYWLELISSDLGTLKNIDGVRETLKQLRDSDKLEALSIEGTGVFAYIITDDFLGGKSLAEIVFYIKPEFRGNLKLVLEYIKTVEEMAVIHDCVSVKIGGNIGYKDKSFIKLLKRHGYIDDTVVKYL